MTPVEPNASLSYLGKLASMGLLGTAVVGFFSAIVAYILIPKRNPGGFLFVLFLGIAGALLSRFISPRVTTFYLAGFQIFITPVIGSFLVLIAYRIVFLRGR
ncbi:MAG: GlsB/YeaQ/YmgE family stress response membrane protein [Elusimicrobia bacterium]|jgi:uncharacterized membrane protein YeaQ/YmgE (transglycosylase-associated protein family)|nr:GlsB/YeaQ/YmgE family stress response membrane protein [Elusimicrobiota bacterium]